MNKTKMFTCIIVASFFCSPMANAGLFGNDYEEVEKLVRIERFDEAQKKIEEIIIDDPENAENLFLGANLYLKMGYCEEAYKNFEFAAKIGGQEYQEKVTDIFVSQAFTLLSKASISHTETILAKDLLKRAYVVYPELYKSKVQKTLKTGKDFLMNGEEHKAFPHFKKASFMDEDARVASSDLYIDVGINSPDNRYFYFNRSIEFYPENKSRIARFLITEIKKEGISNDDKVSLHNELQRYISKKEYLTLFPPPPIRIFHPGTPKIISLKAGETTNYWISFPRDINTHFDVSSDDNKFILEYEDGTKYNAWELKSLPPKTIHTFRLTAVTDQIIKLIVK